MRDYELGTRRPSLEAALHIVVAFGETTRYVRNHPEMSEGARMLQKASRRRRKRDTIRELKQEFSAIQRAQADDLFGQHQIIQDCERRVQEAHADRDAAIAESIAARQETTQAEKAWAQAEEGLANEKRHRDMENKLRQGTNAKQPTGSAKVGVDDSLPWDKTPNCIATGMMVRFRRTVQTKVSNHSFSPEIGALRFIEYGLFSVALDGRSALEERVGIPPST